MENTTAIRFKVGDFVRPNFQCVSVAFGRIEDIYFDELSQEYSYSVNWDTVGIGEGWSDSDLAPTY